MSSPSLSEFARYPSLAGRTVFVTGGSSGIGADIVIAYARQGAKVGFTGRNAEAAAKVVEAASALGPTPLFLQSDAADVNALREAIATTAQRFGDISVLVNNVANDQRHNLADVTPDDFDWRVAINLRPAFFAAQAVVDGMTRLGGGAIVNLGSISWMIKGAGYPVYATCKSATVGLSRSLARDLGKLNIRVNTLSPGWIMTEKQLTMWVDEAGEKAMDENQCLPGRIVGSDVANMALFLSADDSRMVTAQDFVVDAGWT
ncbi:MAG: 3-oxoacyl-ACP reductase [Curvibacter sp. RIFCSPHIGHO2_12_FULL_63_18]|uniref:SDR family NAD(P)-dependent oxidoreductase n=1 Tax=Rhodoferax sp. TaxID=50421 RepID=UPI0008C4BF80|nr:SDR family oxidoreductase [Rhodoferax sp.]OGO97477.1 MAG: 3-oxoacyl-ACP reductase [Curvibacter sp. GWA2_63_95]OGO98779.1 MAG: 3-oxoacyl-ACP reductase [Curvibacter sp. RIFCSPHIGHO2_12_FULL_63_18]HCX81443.1 3-oxoacyl-ACP reductase [Rhodoferax sp.]